MTLKNIILDKIKKDSFIYLDDFMKISLSDDKDSYYCSKKVIGKEGDFITSPEISQLYGETIALNISEYIINKNIKKFNLIELGPGKGTLMYDITRVLSLILKGKVEYNIHFLEINKYFIKDLKDKFKKSTIHQTTESFPNGHSIILANEFFDALPVIQIHNINNDKYETAIELSNEELAFCKKKIRKDNLKFISNEKNYNHLKIKELSPYSNFIFENLIKYLKNNNGTFMIMDYGYTKNCNQNTIQSIKKNKITNFLDNIGNQDLTAHVNFAEFIKLLKKYNIKNFSINSQRDFLTKNGINFRANQLIEKNLDIEDKVMNDLSRLINIDQMGNLFKILKFEV